MRTRIVGSARASRRPIRVLHFFENNAPPGSSIPGQRSGRCHSSVMFEPDAVAHQPRAVIDQQPQIQLRPAQLRRRERVQPTPEI